MSRKKLLASLTVTGPCTESWDAMQGDARSRHCAHCDRDVHNLATMSPRAIEELVIQSGGKFCGRVTRRFDGSLVTLDTDKSSQVRASLAASIAATALIAVGTSNAQAQSSSHAGQTSQAILTGIVLQPHGKAPVPHAIVIISGNGIDSHWVHADASGVFRAEVPSGTYEISISQNIVNSMRIQSAQLHAGEQSIGEVHLPESVYTIVSGGVIADVGRVRFAAILRHPVSYFKYLTRKL